MLVPPLSLAIKDFVVEHLDGSPENLQLIQDFACPNNAFVEIIRPLAKHISTCVGAGWLCIFALPRERLLDYYEKKLGFSRLPADKETFVHGHVKPDYDKDCIFMYQRI